MIPLKSAFHFLILLSQGISLSLWLSRLKEITLLNCSRLFMSSTKDQRDSFPVYVCVCEANSSRIFLKKLLAPRVPSSSYKLAPLSFKLSSVLFSSRLLKITQLELSSASHLLVFTGEPFSLFFVRTQKDGEHCYLCHYSRLVVLGCRYCSCHSMCPWTLLFLWSSSSLRHFLCSGSLSLE